MPGLGKTFWHFFQDFPGAVEQLHVGDGAAAVPRPTGGHLHHLRPHRQGSNPCHVLIILYVSVHYLRYC